MKNLPMDEVVDRMPLENPCASAPNSGCIVGNANIANKEKLSTNGMRLDFVQN
jgi:hypothetical protein